MESTQSPGATPQPHQPPCGILVVDKQLHWSSMDVVAKVRWSASGCPPRRERQRKGHPPQRRRENTPRIKVGHAGTLDPLATGVVIVCVGKQATRLVDQFMIQEKVYEADVDLSAFTASDDAESEREDVDVAPPPTREQVEAALQKQVGLIDQVPPIFSAIHVDGRRAYKSARAGESIKLKARPVRIDAIEMLSYDWPYVSLKITCGKGTYIRSIARDLGKALGTGGYLTRLRRTRVGEFTVDQATPMGRFETPLTQDVLMPLPAVKATEPPADA